ncbi:PREDICTED: uncharacterized protein LOC108368099 [Rhagoletis zephyria]|uniref:uncharacterized protein LOC108368099 n=1 Tax=Rhagoletis zephyria TaxID=28612 RepID=UPI0008119C56|nr:PREDICTED: uncharacterized protein LOC108368099 [Rhagoletis zephyria]
MGTDYEMQAPRMRNPKILIVGMTEELNKDLIVQAISKQNDVECGHLECVKVYKSHKIPQVYNAIIETDGDGYNQLLKRKKINIEWDRCPVYESCSVLRCFKCWGYNRASKVCKNDDQICAKYTPVCCNPKVLSNEFVAPIRKFENCIPILRFVAKSNLRRIAYIVQHRGDSETGHTYKESKNNNNKCINCKNAKERLKLSDIDTNHDCGDSNCRVLQRKNKLEAERVAYLQPKFR